MTMTQLLHKNMVAQLMPNQGTAVPMMKMMVSLNQLQQFGFCCQYNVVIILNVGPFFAKLIMTLVTSPMLTGRLSLLSRLSIAGPKPG